MRTLGTSHPINLENLNSLRRAINSPVKIKDRACNKENKIFLLFFFHDKYYGFQLAVYRGTKRGYSSKPLNITLLNVF